MWLECRPVDLLLSQGFWAIRVQYPQLTTLEPLLIVLAPSSNTCGLYGFLSELFFWKTVKSGMLIHTWPT